MTAVTALTAQSTVGVSGVHPVPGEFIVEQVRAVADDIGVDAVKIGMLGTAATVDAVAEALELLVPGTPVVLDPVMVAESGAVLLDEDARTALVERLIPMVTVITPNLPEARILVRTARDLAGDDGRAADDASAENDERPPGEDVEALVRALHALGPEAVVVTGGHRAAAADVYYDGTTLEHIPGERHPDGAAHGSGCTHSSALAAGLALGRTPLEAARAAKLVAAEAVRDGLREIGAGAGPVDALGLARAAAARTTAGARSPA
jgi:hydroxymethylpyrimidine/phosphomethylpyrimidine kinase